MGFMGFMGYGVILILTINCQNFTHPWKPKIKPNQDYLVLDKLSDSLNF